MFLILSSQRYFVALHTCILIYRLQLILMYLDVLFVVLIVAILVMIYKIKFNKAGQSVSVATAVNNQQQVEEDRPRWANNQQENVNEDQQSQQEQQKVGSKTDMRKMLRKQQKQNQRKARKQAQQHYLEDLKREKQQNEKKQQEKELQQEQKRKKEEEYYNQLVAQQQKKKDQEFNKWKSFIKVQEEGKHNADEQRKKKQMQEKKLIQTLKKNKLTLLQDLSHSLSIPTKEVIQQIKELEKKQLIDGIFDDRGKYLVIEENQWEAVKNFMTAKGRVKKTDIMMQCARIIKIPDNVEDNIDNLMEQYLQDEKK